MADSFSLAGKKVWVAGHRGMVGAALLSRLASEDCEILVAGRADVDLRDPARVQVWMKANRPQVVVVAAAKVGGILANDSYPADFLYDNLMIETNIVHAAFGASVEKLLFLGSSCIYPRLAPQPIREEYLLTGPLEKTNEWYAIAKIAGVKLCQAYRLQHGCDFISAMPTNLYGPGDNYDLQSSHVVPALLHKAHRAKVSGDSAVTIWGTGTPRREFLHVVDCADALVHLLKVYSGDSHVNVGFGKDISIGELALKVMKTVGFHGALQRDTEKPDGTPQKLLDSGKLRALGWTPRIGLDEGLEDAYRWFLRHEAGAGG